ncbi:MULTISPECIES: hypothetical protein [unclassified Microcoleus]|uniref:hypothetical protein n=1 Tax=unclassified Microcoleus TaxID=2642155 RepID=UPI0025F5A73C|nr:MULTISPECIES: hypothetical protein [unclassified Microcoleus]
MLFGEKRSLHRGMCGKGTRAGFPEVWTIANRLDYVNRLLAQPSKRIALRTKHRVFA